MSPPGRPKGEYRSAQHEGGSITPPGRPKGEYRSAQHEGGSITPSGRPKGEYRSAQHDGSRASAPPGLAEGLAALQRIDPAGFAIPGGAAQRLAAYLALLAKWNRTYNLTAIREPERMVTHHVLDALAVLPHLPRRDGLRVLDVGTGAGIPGIPLAIARPAWRVVLLDSNRKKTVFVQQALIELPLANAEAVCARVEDYRSGAPFDVVISRAFADLAAFAATSARHLAPHGVLVAMKGVHTADELAGLPAGLRVVATPELAVPGLDATRHLVIVERETPVARVARGVPEAAAR